MSNKLNLEMSFPITNEFVKTFSKRCCDWGQKKPPYDSQGQVKGSVSIFNIDDVLHLY